MSEKLYALLLRLYPSRFRQEYGEEALQLIRDRARDEKGLLAKLHLWLDLFLDLTVSLPSQYVHLQPELVGPSIVRSGHGAPSFFVLRDESLRPAVLLFGICASLMAIALFWSLLGHGGRLPALSELVRSQPQRPSASLEREFSQAMADGNFAATSSSSAAGTASLDASARHRVIDAAIAELKRSYIDSRAAEDIGQALSAHERSGEYNRVADPRTFADLLTRQMQEVKHDTNLAVFFSSRPLPDQPPATTPERVAQYRAEMQRENCTFEKAQVLRHNIGYLKFNLFPDPSMCQSTAAAAMASLNHTDAVIFDLRDNRGGEPAMVQFMVAYLFDHPEYVFNPRENTSERSWTRSPVPGNLLADKPAYVLTSRATASGAEQFCYNLKMLKRATLVGEKTAGMAHSGAWHRIDENFAMAIPETRPINPYSTIGWSGTGIEPDVKVKAEAALDVALRLAESQTNRSTHP